MTLHDLHSPSVALTLLLVCVPPTVLRAQTSTRYAVSPAGFARVSGNANNNAPFYGASGTYQQIHDAFDLQAITGASTLSMRGMAFRPSAKWTVAAQTWDLQLKLGHTSVSAATMTNTFASNFTVAPTTVLPYTTVNGPAGKGLGSSRPNDVLYIIPFKTPFTYVAALGNLCWEWRHRNNAINAATSPMDAVHSSYTGSVTAGANYGTGCTATGQTIAATCSNSIAGGNIHLALANGRANSPALVWLGLQSAEFTIPGWCAPLYVSPLASASGMTNVSGGWASASAPTSVMNLSPYAEVYTQYAFLDAARAGGIGLSDRGVISAPAHGSNYVSRMYVISRAGNGSENATRGTVLTIRFGLVTHFAIL
jgi:hypothetical protein